MSGGAQSDNRGRPSSVRVVPESLESGSAALQLTFFANSEWQQEMPSVSGLTMTGECAAPPSELVENRLCGSQKAAATGFIFFIFIGDNGCNAMPVCNGAATNSW